MLLPALFFLVWDEIKTRNGVWSFSDYYTVGVKIFSLPVEEVLFFLIVPYCCVFIYECIRIYFPTVKKRKWGRVVMLALCLLFIIAAFFSFGKEYTFYTCLFNAVFILLLVVFERYFIAFDASSFFISYLVIVIPFLIVNGFLTAIPVVMYNDTENLGLRIFSFLPSPMHNIPAEDIFYGMLLILMNIAAFEKIRNPKRQG